MSDNRNMKKLLLAVSTAAMLGLALLWSRSHSFSLTVSMISGPSEAS